MKKDLKIKLTMSALMLSLSACSNQGFEGVSKTSNSNGNSSLGSGSSGGNPHDPTAPASAYDKLEMDSYVSGGNYDSYQVLSLDKTNNSLLLYLPLPAGPFSQVNLDVQNVKGLKIRTVLDSQQNARLAVSIPLKYIVKNKISTLPSATTLPGGRKLPSMPTGEYPSLGLSLNTSSNNKMYLYIGTEAVGLFVESSFFPEYIGITAPIKNKLGTRTLGYFTIVPKSNPYNGGLFLSFVMPKDLGTIIDDHLSGIIN